MNSGLLHDRVAAVENRLRWLYTQHAADLSHGVHQGGERTQPPEEVAGTAAEWQPCDYADTDQLLLMSAEFGLDRDEIDLFACAVSPELSAECGAAYRMLTGATYSTRPTVSIALRILGKTPADAMAQGLLHPGSRLMAGELLGFENPEAAFPERRLWVPDRVVGYVAAAETHARDRCAVQDAVAQTCAGHLQALFQGAGSANKEALDVLRSYLEDAAKTATRGGAIYVREGPSGQALPAICHAVIEQGRLPLLVDPDELEHAPADVAEMMVREARLLDGTVIVPVFKAKDSPDADALRRVIMGLARAPRLVVFYGAGPWDADVWTMTPDATVDLPRLNQVSAATAEMAAFAERPDFPLTERLSSTMAPVVDRARRQTAGRLGELAAEEVRRITHECALRDLGHLGRRIRPAVCREDLILPATVRKRLDALTFRIGRGRHVLKEWRLRRGGGRGWGATALFAGDSGTGKTMAAEAVAAELGVDMYVVSLSSVVSKYIGETEKNLERIFGAAEILGGVVLFDEADSIFAKRGAVRNSNDRYANLQSGYLLQRLESFDGLAILTTNLRSNMDPAFTRRFDEVIEFDKPGPEVRASLWRAYLGAELSQSCDIALLADRFSLAGGSIRSSVETAAFAAAAEERPVSTGDLLQGIEIEYRKLGRLFDAL